MEDGNRILVGPSTSDRGFVEIEPAPGWFSGPELDDSAGRCCCNTMSQWMPFDKGQGVFMCLGNDSMWFLCRSGLYGSK